MMKPQMHADKRGWTPSTTFLLSLLTATVAFAAGHPLDPLTAEEITSAVGVLKASGKAREGALFPSIALREPAKEEVLGFKPGMPVRREAFVMVYERAANKVFDAIVDL